MLINKKNKDQAHPKKLTPAMTAIKLPKASGTDKISIPRIPQLNCNSQKLCMDHKQQN